MASLDLRHLKLAAEIAPLVAEYFGGSRVHIPYSVVGSVHETTQEALEGLLAPYVNVEEAKYVLARLKRVRLAAGASKEGCLAARTRHPIELGSGFFGTVYAVDRRTVAKVTSFDNMDADGFVNEVEIARKAGELGVGPRVLDSQLCCNAAGTVCYGILYMEKARGVRVSVWLQSDPPVAKRAAVAKEIDRLIDMLHDNGIAHNDTHLANVMVDPRTLKVVLLDYGIAATKDTQRAHDKERAAREMANGGWGVTKYVVRRLLQTGRILV